MAALPKSESSPGVLSVTQQIEDQSNKWSEGLAIAGFPIDALTWGMLTYVTLLVEDVIKREGFGSQRHREAMINLSQSGTLFFDWSRTAKFPQKEALLRWTPALSQACREAEQAARNYGSFVTCFTMWHKNRMAVEVLSRDHLRFVSDGSLGQMQRRIRAYQQGVRRPGWPATPDQPKATSFVEGTSIRQRMLGLCEGAFVQGALAVEYPTDRKLLEQLTDTYFVRLESQFRRSPQFDLGGYTLGEFRRFFAALMSLCSVHEHFCFLWEHLGRQYPAESAVMVKTLPEWVEILTGLSGLSDVVATMISDMTFGATRALDIYIHPFFPKSDRQTLYLAPQFIMNSRAEENILRVCSYVRPRLYSTIANAKESEMREIIRLRTPTPWRIHGPIKLPSPLPDIDLVIEDPADSQLLIGELKWTRKTVRAIEHLDRDQELHKGVDQLRAIKNFLDHSPGYLEEQGVASQGSFCYALIGRDHLVWIPPGDTLFLTEFDALLWMFQNSRGLVDGIRKLQTYEWLPKEGEDFVVRHERATVAGVTIETEVFHR